MSITIKHELGETKEEALLPDQQEELKPSGSEWKLWRIHFSNHQTNSKSLQGGWGNYYNPDPLIRLISQCNEAIVLVEGQKCTALVDSGAQVPPSTST